jgi:hypothetical protein
MEIGKRQHWEMQAMIYRMTYIETQMRQCPVWNFSNFQWALQYFQQSLIM